MVIKNLLIIFFVLFIGLFPLTLNAQTPDDEFRITERFSWSGGENALYYEVVFEKEERGRFIAYHNERREQLYIAASFTPGNYRFRIIAYDVLGRLAQESEWTTFQISLPQLLEQPEIAGEHETEPGHELQDELLRSVIFTICASWSPLIHLYGDGFGGKSEVYQGIKAHANLLFLTPINFYIGPQLSLTVCQLDVLIVEANLYAMKWIVNEKIGAGLRLGAAFPILPAEDNDLILGGGASLRWHVSNRFLLESGIDFMHMFTENNSGYLRFWLGVGLHF
jgi:hypothetical protein